MKAAQITQYGDAGVVSFAQDVPRPAVGTGNVLVEVHAASLNPVDSYVRSGYVHQMMPLYFPATLGNDIAGVVVEADPGAGGLKPGDRVFGSASVLAGGSGAFAEYAASARLPSRWQRNTVPGSSQAAVGQQWTT